MSTKIKLGIRDLSISDKCAKGTVAYDSGQNNPDTPNNGPVMTDLKTANDTLASIKAEVTALEAALKAKRSELSSAMDAWSAAYAAAAAYVESVTKGDPDKILGAGFEIRLPAGPTQPVGKIDGLIVELNGKTGDTKLAWTADPNAAFYVVECNADPTDEAGWKEVFKGTATRATISGAQPGKPCFFRVKGWNNKGDGAWSAAVSRPVL